MQQYTITAVSQNVRDWNSKAGGPMKAYRVHLQGADGSTHENVEWSRKADSPPPTVGQQVDAELEDKGQYGMKLKPAQQGRGGGGGPRGRDPQERAEIRRQNAQAQALRYMEIKAGLGLIKDFKPSDLVPVIDFFYADTGTARP